MPPLIFQSLARVWNTLCGANRGRTAMAVMHRGGVGKHPLLWVDRDQGSKSLWLCRFRICTDFHTQQRLIFQQSSDVG